MKEWDAEGRRSMSVAAARFYPLWPSVMESVQEMDRTSELSRLARDGWFCKEDKRGNGENGSVVFRAAASVHFTLLTTLSL